MFTLILPQKSTNMKRNLLTAIVVFCLTFVVLLVTNDASNEGNDQVKDQNYLVDR
jgi:hypothetical protein